MSEDDKIDIVAAILAIAPQAASQEGSLMRRPATENAIKRFRTIRERLIEQGLDGQRTADAGAVFEQGVHERKVYDGGSPESAGDGEVDGGSPTSAGGRVIEGGTP